MTSTVYTSNHRSSGQTVFKSYINFNQNKQDSNPPSKFPSFVNPNHLNNLLDSNISLKNYQYPNCYNSIYSHKSEQDSEFYSKSFFPIMNKNWPPTFLELSQENTKFQSFVGLDGKKFKFDSNNVIFNFVAPENKKEKQKTNNDNLLEYNNETKINNNNNQIILNNIIINDNNNFNYNENIKLEKNNDINLINSTNNNMGAKFFTNNNYGYKCSCSKTQCNRKYCECYNSGNYCIDCNCKNCKNQPPINTYTNKHPSEIVSKMKKSKEICTCTKSGCNKNYCECFKSGNKCTSLCRCIECENTEVNIKLSNKYIYECCRANSIYIIKNKINIENIKTQKQSNQKRYIIIHETYESNNEKMANKKRKRDKEKNFKELNAKTIKKKKKDENILFNDSLFNEKGKLILRHISYDKLFI